MSRATRLLNLLQSLRRRRRPVTAEELAAELGVSVRTVYRDVAALAEQGASIEGAAGLGYMLRPGFFLPPLRFTEDELDALILGLRLVAQRGDESLGAAAEDALSKVAAVLPKEDSHAAATSGLLAAPRAQETPHLAVVREAIRDEQTLRLSYVDKKGRASDRVVWPVAIGFFEAAEVLAAWCETRRDFRHFRLDRIQDAAPTGARIPRHRRVLLADWRAREGLGEMF